MVQDNYHRERALQPELIGNDVFWCQHICPSIAGVLAVDQAY